MHLYESKSFQPTQTWCYVLESLPSINIRACVGESILTRLTAPFDRNTSHISSSDPCVKVHHKERAILFQPIHTGERQVLLTSNSSGHADSKTYFGWVLALAGLIKKMLVHCTASAANITREVAVPIQQDKPTEIQLTYTNPSQYTKLLRISTDRPDLLSFDPTDGLVKADECSSATFTVHITPVRPGRRVSCLSTCWEMRTCSEEGNRRTCIYQRRTQPGIRVSFLAPSVKGWALASTALNFLTHSLTDTHCVTSTYTNALAFSWSYQISFQCVVPLYWSVGS